MLGIKAWVPVLLLSLTLNVAVGACETNRGNSQNVGTAGKGNSVETRQPEQKGQAAVKGDLKLLIEGQHGSISNPFIFIARDAESYRALVQLVPKLEALDENFFRSNAVVAAFLGERRTGGYGVALSRTSEGKLRVEETRPSRGSITTQVITYPFSVVSLPVNNQESLAIEMGESWRAAARPYKVKDGEFTMSGGITGRSQKFIVTGNLGIMREGKLATLLLDLKGKNGAEPRILKDVASGLVESNGSLTIGHLGAGSFVDMPADALRAKGQFSTGEKSLSLSFDSIPGTVADGYNGRGSLTAEAQGPAPQKRSRPRGDVPL